MASAPIRPALPASDAGQTASKSLVVETWCHGWREPAAWCALSNPLSAASPAPARLLAETTGQG